jgi:hypothetical protein
VFWLAGQRTCLVLNADTRYKHFSPEILEELRGDKK